MCDFKTLRYPHVCSVHFCFAVEAVAVAVAVAVAFLLSAASSRCFSSCVIVITPLEVGLDDDDDDDDDDEIDFVLFLVGLIILTVLTGAATCPEVEVWAVEV